MASVGFTEAKAKEAGYEVRVGKFPFIGNGKAIALGEAEDGFVKTVFDANTGELLGAHMIGAEVTELIQGYVIARQLETTEAELMPLEVPSALGVPARSPASPRARARSRSPSAKRRKATSARAKVSRAAASSGVNAAPRSAAAAAAAGAWAADCA